MIGDETHDWADFIRSNTRLLRPPLVPELQLHLAEESLPIWRRTEEELAEENVPPPYWAFAWAGGQALARYLLDHPEIVHGRSVTDLGSGSGITAIAAARAGARHILAADIDAVACVAIRLNAEVNEVRVDVTQDDLLRSPPLGADVVLIGDLFYERPLAAAVMTYIVAAQEGGARIIVGDPRRSYFPKDRFVSRAEYRVPVTRELEDAEIKQTAVWELA